MGEYSKGVSIYIKKCEFVHEIRTKIIIKNQIKMRLWLTGTGFKKFRFGLRLTGAETSASAPAPAEYFGFGRTLFMPDH